MIGSFSGPRTSFSWIIIVDNEEEENVNEKVRDLPDGTLLHIDLLRSIAQVPDDFVRA